MFYTAIKRGLDVIGSIVAIVVFSPLFILIAVIIKLDSPGPVFYLQERVTTKGRLFRMLKFRSMKLEYSAGSQYGGQQAEEFLQQILSDPKQQEQFNTFYKLPNDPRVTRVGRILRKSSLDELPQFFNVLTGAMSIVGPRAYLAKELLTQMEVYPQIRPEVKKLLTIKPGITGPWQISGRNRLTFDQRVAMDVNYAQRRSIWFDLLIVLRTPWAVLSGKGAM